MLKIIVFVLFATSLSSKSPNSCVSNRVEDRECNSNVCFSHYYTLPEGDVESFDCSEEPNKLNRSSCLQILRTANRSTICLESANATHCCCLADETAKICAEEQRNTDQLAQLWTLDQAVYLVFGHISLLIVALVIFCLYKVSVCVWTTDNVPVNEDNRLEAVLLGKAVFLLFSFLVIYFPFRKSCKGHEKGVFVTPRLFVYQIFSSGIAPSIYFSFPVVFFIFEFTFFMTVKLTGTINKSGGLAMAVFKMLTTPLFVYETFFSSFTLWAKDHQSGYCSLGGAVWQLMISHFFIFCYHILLVFQIVLLYQMKSTASEVPQRTDESSNHVATLMSSQTVETQIESDFNEMIYIYPRPFHVPRFGISVLNVKNNRKNEWIALRCLLSTTGFYKLYPTKFLIPPGKEISVEVDQCTRSDSPTTQHNLLLEWFSLGTNPPSVDCQRLWSKPFLVPQNQWQYFVLPIYMDQSISSASASQVSSVTKVNK